MNLERLLASFRERVDFDFEEPGTFVILILLVTFIAVTPKASCAFHEAPDSAVAATTQ
jgi:hypothetical protein